MFLFWGLNLIYSFSPFPVFPKIYPKNLFQIHRFFCHSRSLCGYVYVSMHVCDCVCLCVCFCIPNSVNKASHSRYCYCLCVFSASHLRLAKYLVCSSLGKTISPASRFPHLPVVLCVRWAFMSFLLFTLTCLQVSFLFSFCWGNFKFVASAIRKRHNLRANSTFLRLLHLKYLK